VNVTIWKRPRGLEWLAALFLFFMLREWLLPLKVLTDTGTLEQFYYIAAGVLLLDLFVPHRWLTFPFKLMGILWLLHASFFVTPLFDTEWLKETAARLTHDVPLMMQQQWTEMSPISRNFLFDLLLIVLISLLTYLVLEQRQGLWFVFLTELYLAVLDTFMPYEADGGIIRTLVLGFLLLAVTHLNLMQKMATVSGNGRLTLWNSLIAPVLIVSLTVGIAYVAPKKAASWPDPIAYLTGKGTGAATNFMKKVGYDNNDERLGGPFVQDDSLVFVAITNERTYWRGDSKDIYTGVGWQKGEREYESILEPREYRWGDTLFRGMETKQVIASLNFQGGEQFPTVFYPGQLKRLISYTPDNATIVYDKQNQQLEVRDGKITLIPPQSSHVQQQLVGPNNVLMKLRNYRLEAEVPIVSEKALVNAGTSYPEEIKARYLQLPPHLPQRIKELAQSVTKDARTPYEKVRAIENYLRSSGKYKYETTDVPVPLKGQDFVDQFLFESFRGYCDHFSSSMAVMLRSIGIPTRWVKGFAPGTRVADTENGNEVIEVRSKDAHSWVEVYFPEYGWIPFEATSTFLSPVRIKYDLNPVQQSTPIPLPNAGDVNASDRGDGRLDELEEGDITSDGGFRIPGEVYAAALALAAIIGFSVWKRRRLLEAWWIKRQMSTYEGRHYTDKYRLLLRLAESVLSRRQPGETLREYVTRLTISGDKRQDLWYLTELYERMYYGFKEMEEKAKTVANQLLERLSQQLKP
jgi:transglutaminase-like putative cysteine protease